MDNNQKMASFDELDQRIWAILDEQDKVLSELEALMLKPLQYTGEPTKVTPSSSEKGAVPELEPEPELLTKCLPMPPDHKDILTEPPTPIQTTPPKDRIQPISWEIDTKKTSRPQTKRVRPNHRGRGK